ncbi:adenosylmethionine-8-amino-7-oxononanoate aminotransferase [Mycolicibacterium phlei]|uniref:Aminotransferase n=1 Tax=Mycolicibacterium phlei DSM 43239 = CCUG 21000 TaxID=1226750 RepID=A0A5N5UZ57_MYCPH|nr:aminotransferase class III-fold pyridoxal phosphate-dependent enzyme [Mycolicibacterium phlei]VEG11994.1 adenosylmethionine-8-amino-7-oxononanoate aminotransferase [Mycobacteroides chelonae]AMO63904.1 Adenosylmethionine-8-amino-7-oxononanoate aminotransferase [Mycolicibacterium phlei]KAB7754708.1 aminotransferase [Mycolicibacterium phlei DSM 43239 = CCUG 21000]KXW65352.1 aminotransferase [Mycolicibacterium phlei DSM 43239 = CCUG 21000]KXW70626.1 aminotransferase [Mycolicibacterium phlei DSM
MTAAASTPALWPAQAHVPSVLGRQIVVERGEGSYIVTADGRRLFDGTAGLWHANVGHGRPELADAAAEQMRRLETYHVFGRFVNDQAVALAERLAAMSPIPDSKVILNSGGGDAIDLACKLARRHWQRAGRRSKTMILSREYAYHGLHAYGTSIGGLDFNREGYGTESLVPETARIPLHDVAATAALIDEIGADNIAALVTEPVQGTGGVHPPREDYLRRIADLCRANDILLILDEVITGFGRTGTMFAAERYGVTPDLITFAKGVTSGYAPLGGVLIARPIWEPFFADGPDTPIFRHGATYSGHATACAVAMRNLDILEQEALLDRVKHLAVRLGDGLTALAQRCPGVAEVRFAGFLGGVALTDDLDAVQVADRLIDAGFVSRPLRGNTLQISPPYITTDDELDAFLAAIETTVTELAS